MFSSQNKTLIEEITDKLETHGNNRASLPYILPVLQDVNKADAESGMLFIADKLDIPPVEISSLLSFYEKPNAPAGKVQDVRLCRSMCFRKGEVKRVAEALQKKMQIHFGECSADGARSLNWAAPVYDPQQTPVLIVNDRMYPHVQPEDLEAILSDKSDTASYLPDIFVEKNIFSGLKFEEGIKAVLQANISRKKLAGFDVLVCNCDEGEPLTMKSRAFISEYFSQVVEGMLVFAYLNEIEKGLIYLPGRYAYLKPVLDQKLTDFRKQSLIGKDIFGHKGFDFEIEVLAGMGNYIGREETTLAAMLNGFRPEFDAHNKGTQPYHILSVDYFLKALYLAERSPEKPVNEKEISALPALVSISGDCEKPGVYEIKKGTMLKEILQHVGAKDACEVQVGGVSAPMISQEDFNTPVDVKDLEKIASIVIYGAQTNLLDAAQDILAYFHEASCGQCVPCRNGIPVLMRSLQLLANDQKRRRPSLAEIRSLAETIQLASKCSVGQCAPNAFLSILDIAEQDMRNSHPIH